MLKGKPDTRAAVVAGLAVSFVVSIYLVGAIRLSLLTDPDPSWALPRLLLGLFLITATATAGGTAAGLFLVWTGSRFARPMLQPFPASPRATALIAAAAVAIGIVLRVAFVGRLPIPFIWDEVSLITPALELTGTLHDFANSIRGLPYGVEHPHEVIGVVFLYLLRGSLELFGPTAVGLQAISALGGVLSLFTAAALGRALLPQGGAALVCALLGGLRWHLIVSLRGWQAIMLTVFADLASLAALSARRRGSIVAAFGGGILTGIGAHLYFSAWIVAAGLGLFLLWPREASSRRGTRASGAIAFGFGVLMAASPLFLFREGRGYSILDRITFANVFVEARHAKSSMPLFQAAAEPLASPWFVPDSDPLNDLPGRSRLGWIIGIPFALGGARALLFPRQDFSALLLAHGLAALAAAWASGAGGNPHGTRFAHLTTLTAVAAAGGVLQLLTAVAPSWRRVSGIAAVGLLAISGALAARDALGSWPYQRATFESYSGQVTLLGLAAARWEKYGRVEQFGRSGAGAITVEAIRRYRLDRFGALPAPVPGEKPIRNDRRFRLVWPGTVAGPNERVVERVKDGWGREWALVLGRRCSPACSSPF